MRGTALAFVIVAALALATVPAQADGVVSVSVEGECTNGPDSGLDACVDGAQEGDTPDGGSYLAAHASAADGAAQAQASTVPATDFASGQSEQLTTEAAAEGACKAGGAGGSDSASASVRVPDFLIPHTVNYPDEGNVRSAIVGCATNGGPGPGSYLAAGASAGSGTASVAVDTVPATNQLP